MIAHLVLGSLRGDSGVLQLQYPLDVFVINLHLTTLMGEREGIPQVDEEATRKRLAQLEVERLHAVMFSPQICSLFSASEAY